MEFADVELYLAESGFDGLNLDDWEAGDRTLYLTRVLRGLPNEGLHLLVNVLGTQSAETPEPVEVRAAPLSIFISHPSASARVAREISNELATYGVLGFVAHEDIQPDASWRQEIAGRLGDCDCCLALLAPGFHTSDWCEQEVGWMLGRGVPVVSIRAGEEPRGPFAERQALTLPENAQECANKVLDVLELYVSVKAQLVSSYVSAMRNSLRFAQTDRIWVRLRSCDTLSVEDCAELWYAAKINSQVSGAECRPDSSRAPYPVVIQRFIEQQQSYLQSNLDLPTLFRLGERLVWGDDEED